MQLTRGTHCGKIMSMNKTALISAIIQLISALILVGISVYYYIDGNTLNFLLFLGVGALFLALSVKALCKYFKDKKDK